MTLGGIGERAVIAFRQEHFFSFGVRSARFLGRKVGIGVDRIEMHRRRLSRLVFDKYKGVIQHGPFSGVKLLADTNWGEGDRAAMLLGIYEREVLDSLLDTPDSYRIFVDIGAADGYYSVGLLRASRFDRAVCFEINEFGRRSISRLAVQNGVSDRVTLLKGADLTFPDELESVGVALNKAVFLLDIEGFEFQLLQSETLEKLKNSIIIVELHENIIADGAKKLSDLYESAQKTHKLTRIFPGPRDPTCFTELADFQETDRWIICSEGRSAKIQTWLRLDPL